MKQAIKTVPVVLLLLALAASCATTWQADRDGARIEKEIQGIEEAASICAPRDAGLALAEADLARLEASLGNTYKAYLHLEEAQTHLTKVREIALNRDGTPKPGCEGDKDWDGVLDSRDYCPAVAEDCDGDQDQDGCPEFDKDGDGIRDESDRCPDLAEDRDGYEDDDGCPDTDNDLDGIQDVADKCINQPEDFDAFEDEDGCPDLDNDLDGIPDLVDKCPMQPEDFDGDQDDDGCEDVYKNIVVEDKRIQLKQKIFFNTNGSNILMRSFEMLDEVAIALNQNPELKVKIEGHTDDKGKDAYNLKLSTARAQSVRSYLIKKGVAPERLVAIGYGETKPISENTSEEGREMNRRVEFNIIDETAEPKQP